MRGPLATLAILGCLANASPAAAQGPVGIAIAEAPEAGSGVCFAGNPESGFSCARDKCVAESGLEPGDCLRVRWCYPSGWTADIFLQTADGFHFHRYICGSGSREEMISLARALCRDPQKANYLECSFARAWDPEGNDVEVDETLRTAR